MTDDNTQAPVDGVGQADRQAAYDQTRGSYGAWFFAREILEGKRDDHPVVQAFARHRQSARSEGVKAGLEMAIPPTITEPLVQALIERGLGRLTAPETKAFLEALRSLAQTGTGAG